ncbi:hypothetical protein NSU_4054 [Novosphingobium pentaromativorans US6-1]|uniref:Uncharacterized protein n=1 Tax=Novosphingobium pentaromativorans US6-1 TaxID=1088721 RepID=G6EI84_9SPHN|nr:hypothetical protein NSU_4054 [Novosphingobium pentaromativorans US6-1]
MNGGSFQDKHRLLIRGACYPFIPPALQASISQLRQILTTAGMAAALHRARGASQAPHQGASQANRFASVGFSRLVSLRPL